MGKAIAHLQAGRTAEAEAAFTHIIEALAAACRRRCHRPRRPAGAYANRGILYDRESALVAALADYRQALAVDATAVGGPGCSTASSTARPGQATVAARAAYIEHQLALPENERLLHVPELTPASACKPRRRNSAAACSAADHPLVPGRGWRHSTAD
ncbi:MAG: hypothetical protein U1E33_04395 [Rhodospirillales bacterium]